MSKTIVSILTAMAVFAPSVPVYAKNAAPINSLTTKQLQNAGELVYDMSDVVTDIINNIEIEQQKEEVSYVYVESPVYTPLVYYETKVVEQAPAMEVIQEVDNSYAIALENYENALAAYYAASELVETTREEEVEITEEIVDEDGNISTITRTEIQTIIETSYAGDVDAAKAVLDEAAAVLEASQTPEVAETVIEDEETVSETVLLSASDNQCGDDATWTLSAMGVLQISGTGSMYDYTKDEHAPWYSQKLMVNEVVVGSGITRIGNYSFDQCNRITSVSIADTVTEIGKYAFNFNSGLVEVVIPDSVTLVDGYAFNWCNKLETVELGSGLSTIGVQAFYQCQKLDSVVLPSSVKTIGQGAFKECIGLSSITLNSGLQTISASCFSGCTSLTNIEIPNTVTSIGSNIFAGCSSLMNINVHSLNTKYASIDGILYNKAKTTLIQCPMGKSSVTIPDTVTKIGNSAFYQCSNLLSIALIENITSIGSNAFYQCNGLTEMILPDSVMSLGSSAFSMCRYLESMDLGNSLTSIPTSAFLSCDRMTSIILPNTLTSIAANAFSSCTALKDVYYRGKESEWTEKALFEFSDTVTMHYMADYVMNSMHSLSLEGNIGVNFYFLFSDEVLADQDARVEFTIDGNTKTALVKDSRKSKINNQYYRVFTAEVTSIEMTTDIIARVIMSNGDVVYEEAYTVKEYCDHAIAASSNEKLVQLMKNLLNYGGYAQINFGYNIDNLANADVDSIDVSDVTADVLQAYAHIETGSQEGLNYTGSSLILDSLTTINHIFTLSNGHTIDEYEFKLGDQVLTPIKRGSRYYVSISNISSLDLDEPYTVQVGDYAITYSALSYAYKVLMNDSTTVELKDACRALYKYNQAANAYFE